MNSVFIRKSLFAFCVLSVFVVFIVACSDKDDDVGTRSQETVLTFENLNIIERECGQSFTRDNMALTLESSYGYEGECGELAEDCCFANESADNFIEQGSLWICKGRLVVDLTQLGTIEKISVTLGDWGHNQVALYNNEGERIAVKENTEHSVMETIIFDTQLDNVHSVVVSGCECLVETITINYKS